MIPNKQQTTGDICKSHSYNGFEEQKVGPLSCENSRPSSTSAHYNDDLNNNQINNSHSQTGEYLKNQLTNMDEKFNNDQFNNRSNMDNNQLDQANSSQIGISNEELSGDDNLASTQNESSNEDANINVPNYLLLADEQIKTDSTMYFAPKHGLQHTALGIRIPKLINTFTDENLEFAYQLYSMR